MYRDLLKSKLSENFIFDGIILMFINFILMFTFGVIFGIILLLRILFNKYGWQLPFSPIVIIIFFGVISIYLWYLLGVQLGSVLKTKKLLKILAISLIGSAPILLVFIYENLLIGLDETRKSGGVVRGLFIFSIIVIASLLFQFVSVLTGTTINKERVEN